MKQHMTLTKVELGSSRVLRDAWEKQVNRQELLYSPIASSERGHSIQKKLLHDNMRPQTANIIKAVQKFECKSRLGDFRRNGIKKLIERWKKVLKNVDVYIIV